MNDFLILRDDFFVLVMAASGANPVGQLGLATAGTLGQVGGLKTTAHVRTAHAPLGLRNALLRNCHKISFKK